MVKSRDNGQLTGRSEKRDSNSAVVNGPLDRSKGGWTVSQSGELVACESGTLVVSHFVWSASPESGSNR